MLAFVQFPIADLRYFLKDQDRNKLTKPSWPPSVGMGLPRPFVRNFGGVSKRNRGADSAWLDEIVYCNANRAIRFTKLEKNNRFNLAFRRLFSDGHVVARVEIGASYGGFDEKWRYRDWGFSYEEDSVDPFLKPVDLVTEFLCLHTIVKTSSGSKSKMLGLQGTSLASLFAKATTITKKATSKRMVKPCIPLVLVECTEDMFKHLPNQFKKIDENDLHGAKLAFGTIKLFGGECGIWFVNYQNCDFKHMRSVRLCLARLHAEREALRCTLEAIENQQLKFEPRTVHGDRLEEYLNKKISLVTREYWHGVKQSAIKEILEMPTQFQSKNELRLLKQRLDGARKQVANKVQDYREKQILTAPNVLIEELNMNTKTINNTISGSTINAPVAMAENIQNSFNTISEGSAPEEIKQMMEKLLSEISEAGVAFGGQSEMVSKDAASLSQEVASEKPRRKWYELSIEGLKEAAKAVGEVGEPILKTLGTLLPMLVALYP